MKEINSIEKTKRNKTLDSTLRKDESSMWEMLSILQSAGVPNVQSLLMLRQTFPSQKRISDAMIAGTCKGKSLAESIERFEPDANLHPFTIPFLRSGEESGNLSEMLYKLSHHISDSLDKKNTNMSDEVKNKILFYTCLGNLVDAGLPILRSLHLVSKDVEFPPERVYFDLEDKIEGCSTLSEAMSNHPKYFTPFELNMVKAGEAAGALQVTLSRLAEYYAKDGRNKRIDNKSILEKYASHADKILDAISKTKERVYQKISARKNMSVEKNKSNAIPTYDLSNAGEEILMWNMFGTLLCGGVPILQTFNILGSTFPKYSSAIKSMHDDVKEGESLANSLKKSTDSGKLHPYTLPLVCAGEETGALPEMCVRISEMIQDEKDLAMKNIPYDLKGRISFYSRISDMSDAGYPLLRTLHMMSKIDQYISPKVISGLADAIEGGCTFAEAMSQYKNVFTPFELNMVKAGEASGSLCHILNKTAEYLKRTAESK
jgi:type II secretory pathway component PulF